ncbi:ZNF16 protein, partial [Regulus satrapa]|nr:ZNF16 protein [Regulus satrapa]
EGPSKCWESQTSSWSSELVEKPQVGEKSHRCLECGKGFNRISNLIQHQMFHTEEQPFMCRECGKSLSWSSYLIHHQMIH